MNNVKAILLHKDFLSLDERDVFVHWGLPYQDRKIDLVYFDPPFNIGVGYSQYNDDKSNAIYEAFLRDAFTAIKVLRPKFIAAFLPPIELHYRVLLESCNAKYELYEHIIWHRTFGTQSNSPRRLSSTFTNIFILRNLDFGAYPKWDRIKIPSQRELKYFDDRAAVGGKIPGRVWEIPNNPESDVWKISMVNGTFNERVHWHPAQHPRELAERIILPLSDEYGWVLDPMCGSATSKIAATANNRNWIGIEIDREYVEKGRDRSR